MAFESSLLPINDDSGPVHMLTGPSWSREREILLGAMAKGKGSLNKEDQKGFPEDGLCSNHREISSNAVRVDIN